MNVDIFKDIYQHRNVYPLGVDRSHENFRDFKYIRDELGRQAGGDFIFLLLTPNYFDKPYTTEILQEISRENQIVGIFNVGTIFQPLTNISMQLYVLRDINTPNHKIWFGELAENKRPFKMRRFDQRSHSGLGIEFGEPEEFFLEFLKSINLAIGGDKKLDYINSSYRIFGSNTWGERLNVEYYRPELIELETKIAHEDTIRLGDIADLIHPNETAEENTKLYTIKLSNANYPLRPEALLEARPGARVTKVKNGDIVTNKFLNSAYQNLTERRDLVIANTQIIIRLHDKRFNAAYLTTYLNSERMKVFFERRKRGATIPMISKQDLADFKIVIPTPGTNAASKKFLSSLGEFESAGDRIKAIDQLLFQRNPLLAKPLQNELLSELYRKLQATKNTQIRELFELDLHEIEKCYKAGAYKASLVLCGSLLEALVLDWLSEVDQHNYFEDTDITNLESLINKLRAAERLSQHEAHLAHDIRKKRNLIHPKNYIVNSPLEKSVCESVMRGLGPLVKRRYEINKNA
jgi:hypothetical protein